MSCRTSVYNTFQFGCRGRAILSFPRVQVYQSALSRSNTPCTIPVRGQQDPKAGVQLRRNFSSAHIKRHFEKPAEPDHLDSVPVKAWSDCSVKNEARWKNFAPAKGATGILCAGRSILLTGGTSGIGLAVAKRAVLESASHVIIVSRSPSKGAGAVREITEATECPDAPLSYLSHDFSTCSPELISSTLKPLYINTLINCSGVTSNQLILKQRQEDAETVWATNYHMPFKLSQHLLSRYLSQARSLQKTGWQGNPAAQPSWCIVNVSSLLAEKGGQGSATYAATKAALTALTRVLALEGGDLFERSRALMPPLRANAILPGYIDTPMIEGFSESRKVDLTAQIPLRRFGKPAEVADAIMFLLHNEYANNCVLKLDGGLSGV